MIGHSCGDYIPLAVAFVSRARRVAEPGAQTAMSKPQHSLLDCWHSRLLSPPPRSGAPHSSESHVPFPPRLRSRERKPAPTAFIVRPTHGRAASSRPPRSFINLATRTFSPGYSEAISRLRSTPTAKIGADSCARCSWMPIDETEPDRARQLNRARRSRERREDIGH